MGIHSIPLGDPYRNENSSSSNSSSSYDPYENLGIHPSRLRSSRQDNDDDALSDESQTTIAHNRMVAGLRRNHLSHAADRSNHSGGSHNYSGDYEGPEEWPDQFDEDWLMQQDIEQELDADRRFLTHHSSTHPRPNPYLKQFDEAEYAKYADDPYEGDDQEYDDERRTRVSRPFASGQSQTRSTTPQSSGGSVLRNIQPQLPFNRRSTSTPQMRTIGSGPKNNTSNSPAAGGTSSTSGTSNPYGRQYRPIGSSGSSSASAYQPEVGMSQDFVMLHHHLHIAYCHDTQTLKRSLDALLKYVIPPKGEDEHAYYQAAEEASRMLVVQLLTSREEVERDLLLDALEEIFDTFLSEVVGKEELDDSPRRRLQYPFNSLQAALDNLHYVGRLFSNIANQPSSSFYKKLPCAGRIMRYLQKYTDRLTPLPPVSNHASGKRTRFYTEEGK